MLSPKFQEWLDGWKFKPENMTDREVEIANAAYIAGCIDHLCRLTSAEPAELER